MCFIWLLILLQGENQTIVQKQILMFYGVVFLHMAMTMNCLFYSAEYLMVPMVFPNKFGKPFA